MYYHLFDALRRTTLELEGNSRSSYMCCSILFIQFVRLKFYFHVLHVVFETSSNTEQNVRMTAQSSGNNLLGKNRNKAAIVLIIDGTVYKERLSGIFSVRTVFCMLVWFLTS
jgi:hypothetical protein